MTNRKFDTKKMVVLALFCAMAYATMFVLRIKVSFLTFDAKDTIITIAAMLFGPASGVGIAFTVATLELITVSDTALYGWLMNFASSAVFSMMASAIYQRKRKMSSAVIGLATAVVSLTAVMMLLNLLITPLYMKTSVQAVMTFIPTLLLPFNFTKALLNAALVLVLYKPVSVAMKRSRVIDASSDTGYRFGLKSVVFIVVGITLTALCIYIMMNLLGGEFSLFYNKS